MTTETQIIDVKAKLDPSLQALADLLRSTTKSYRDLMSSLVDAAKAGKITEAQFKEITGTVTKLGAGAKSSTEGMTAAEKAMTGWAASMRQLEGSMSTLPVRIEQVKTALAAMRAAGDTSSGTYKANVIALRSLEDQMVKFDSANKGSVNGLKDMRFAAQNAAFQLTDMAVSLKGGQNAAMVMAQQLPQLIAGFGGAKAAVAGLVVTLAAVSFSPLISQLQDWLDGEKRFTDSMKRLDETMKSAFQGLQEFNTDSWVKSFNEADAAGQRLMKTMLEISKLKIGEDLKKSAEEMANINWNLAATSFLGAIQRMFTGNEELAERFRITAEQSFELKRAFQELDVKDSAQVVAFWERWGTVLQQTTNPAVKEQVQLLSQYVTKIYEVGKATDQLNKLSLAAVGQRVALDVEKATAAYREQVLVLQDRKNLIPTQLAELKSLRDAGKITAEVYKEQTEALLGTKGAAKKAGDEMKRLREEWANLVGKSDPVRMFDDAVKQAEALRKKVGGSKEELDQIIDRAAKIRDMTIKKLMDEKVIEDFAKLYGVSQDTAKELIKIKDNAAQADEKLKAMAFALSTGDTQFANQIADSLDLKVVPAAERASSAFRRMKSDADKTAENQVSYEAWIKTSEAIGATAAQVALVGKQTGAIVPATVQIQEAWEKLANDRNGLVKMREALEDFIKGQKALGEMTEELAEKLRTAFGVNTTTLIESMNVAIGTTLANGVSDFVDVLTDSEKSFREWATSLIKEIGKVMIKLAALAAFKTFSKGTFLENLIPSAGATRSNVIPFPQTPTLGLSRFAADEGFTPLIRMGTAADASATNASQAPLSIVVNNTISDVATVDVAETQQPDGSREISVLIRKEVRAMMSDGSADRLMRTNYGLRRSIA